MELLKLGQLVVRQKSRIRNFGDKRNYMREIVWRNLSYDICIYHFYVVPCIQPSSATLAFRHIWHSIRLVSTN